MPRLTVSDPPDYCPHHLNTPTAMLWHISSCCRRCKPLHCHPSQLWVHARARVWWGMGFKAAQWSSVEQVGETREAQGAARQVLLWAKGVMPLPLTTVCRCCLCRTVCCVSQALGSATHTHAHTHAPAAHTRARTHALCTVATHHKAVQTCPPSHRQLPTLATLQSACTAHDLGACPGHGLVAKFTKTGAGSGSEAKRKKVFVPKVNLQFWAPLMNFIFSLCLMWGGGGSGGGAQAAIPPAPAVA